MLESLSLDNAEKSMHAMIQKSQLMPKLLLFFVWHVLREEGMVCLSFYKISQPLEGLHRNCQLIHTSGGLSVAFYS